MTNSQNPNQSNRHSKGKQKHIACLLAAFVMSSGCTAFLPKRHGPDEGQLPAQFTTQCGKTKPPDRWWTCFKSDELNTLVNDALANNLTLRQAWARLEQARATAAQVEASLYPDLSLESNTSYERQKTTQRNERQSLRTSMAQTAMSTTATTLTNQITSQLGGSNSTATSTKASTNSESTGNIRLASDTKAYSLGVAASYEIDLWGRIWSERQSANFELNASSEDLQTTAMSLAAEVTSRWLNVIERQSQLRVLQEQLETNRTYLELVELRFNKSMVSALDVYQQRQAVESIEKQIPLMKAQKAILQNELALLLGKPPRTELNMGQYDISKIPPLPYAGIPADILLNRPDVRAAYAKLKSADYSVAAARADLLPAIRLTGRAAFNSGELEFLVDDWLANIAANLTAPLFDGSRRKAEVARSLAVVEERLAGYRLAILTAIKEIEDALLQEQQHHEYLAALERQLDSANSALREATARYRKGRNDYLPVLTALQTTHQLSRDLIEAQRELLIYRINLYRALGGTWTSEIEPSPRLSTDDGQKNTETQS